MLNQIIIQGRLTKDPELRFTQNDKAVATITLACERDFRQTGEKPETDFIDVVAWGKTGEFGAKYFSKGDMMVVSGRIQVRTWKNDNGETRSKMEVNAERIYFCGSKKAKNDRGNQQSLEMPDEELPFV